MSKILKETAFLSAVPNYIMFDLDLNAQHIRLYAIIEEMENRPTTTPIFSYSWLANELGLKTKRAAIKIAKTLKEKGYIRHEKIVEGAYKWSTVKQKG